MREKSQKKILIFALLVAILSLVYCLSIGTNKRIGFCDEVYTYESANLPGKSNVFHSINTWITGKDIQWYLSAEGYNPHFGEINEKLWEDHVPLYFWCIRVMSILFFDSCSPMIGIGVNAIFFSLFSFWLTVRICQLFQKWTMDGENRRKSVEISCRIVVCAILALFLWMQAAVFQLVFLIRPYILLFCLGIMVPYEYVRFFFEPCQNNREDKKKLVWFTIKLTLLVVCGLLSHYHFWVLLLISGVMTWLICVWKKQWYKSMLLIIHAICAIGITTCLFPQWLHNLFVYKGADARVGLFTMKNWGPGILRAIKQLALYIYPWENLPWYFVWAINIVIILIASLLMVKCKHFRYLKAFLWLFTEAVLFAILVSVSAAYLEETRYYSVPQTMLALIVYLLLGYIIVNGIVLLSAMENQGVLLQSISKAIFKITILISVGFLTVTLICSGLKTFNKRNISSLTGGQNEALLESIAEIPWMVHTAGFHWVGYCSGYDLMYAKNICFTLNDPQFMDYSLSLPNEKELILFSEEVYYDSAITYLEKLTQKDVVGEKIGTSHYLNIYHIEFTS